MGRLCEHDGCGSGGGIFKSIILFIYYILFVSVFNSDVVSISYHFFFQDGVAEVMEKEGMAAEQG